MSIMGVFEGQERFYFTWKKVYKEPHAITHGKTCTVNWSWSRTWRAAAGLSTGQHLCAVEFH